MRTGIFNAHGISGGTGTAFNLTPVIDIVFLLIIFFAVVCRFIGAENFPVEVPGGCEYARDRVESPWAGVTVSVMKSDDMMSDFAVGSEKVGASSYGEVAEELAGLINERLREAAGDGVVTLRMDKDIPYAEAQYALAALARSEATEIRLAVVREAGVRSR